MGSRAQDGGHGHKGELHLMRQDCVQEQAKDGLGARRNVYYDGLCMDYGRFRVGIGLGNYISTGWRAEP